MIEQLKTMKVGDKIPFGEGNWGDGHREKLEVAREFSNSQESRWQFQVNSTASGAKFSYNLERIK